MFSQLLRVGLFTLGLYIFAPIAEACTLLSIQSIGSVELSSLRLGLIKNLRVEKKSGTCQFAVSFGRSLDTHRLLKGASEDIKYGIYRDTSKQDFLGDENSGSILKGSFSQSGFESITFPVYFAVNETQLNQRAGFYRDAVEMRLNQILTTSSTLISSTSIPIVYYQQPFYELTLTSSGGSTGSLQHRLNFDRLEKGKMMSFDILVKSNVPHQISFRSQNLGRLRNQSLSNQFIPYTLRVQGQDIDLRRGEVNLNAEASHGQERLNGQVQIQDVSQALSGQYRDFISIVVEAR